MKNNNKKEIPSKFVSTGLDKYFVNKILIKLLGNFAVTKALIIGGMTDLDIPFEFERIVANEISFEYLSSSDQEKIKQEVIARLKTIQVSSDEGKIDYYEEIKEKIDEERKIAKQIITNLEITNELDELSVSYLEEIEEHLTDDGHLHFDGDFYEIIDSNDENFYKFADLFFAKDEIKNTTFEVTPDDLKDKLFPVKKGLLRWNPFHQTEKNTSRVRSSDVTVASLRWLLKPQVAFLSFVTLFVLFMVYPIIQDKNNIFLGPPDSIENYKIIFKTPLDGYRDMPDTEKKGEDDLISFSELKLKKKINNKMIQYVSYQIDANYVAEDEAPKWAAPSDQEAAVDSIKMIMNQSAEKRPQDQINYIDGMEIYRVEDQIAFKQLDDKERFINIFRNNQLFLTHNSKDMELTESDLLIVDLTSTEGDYRITINYLKEEIYNKSFIIEYLK